MRDEKMIGQVIEIAEAYIRDDLGEMVRNGGRDAKRHDGCRS